MDIFNTLSLFLLFLTAINCLKRSVISSNKIRQPNLWGNLINPFYKVRKSRYHSLRRSTLYLSNADTNIPDDNIIKIDRLSLDNRKFDEKGDLSGEDYVELKYMLVSVVDQAWSAVRNTLSAETFALCESDLKAVTSLLILAAIRRSADEFSTSNEALEWMLRTADVNDDGDLTFNEWYDWLLSSTSLVNSTSPGFIPVDSAKLSEEAIKSNTRNSYSAKDIDPMVSSLALVLDNAISTLRIMIRMTSDPTVLIAAYVAGGMSVGELDSALSTTLLTRLNPLTRTFVLQGIAMETTSTTYLHHRESSLSSTRMLATAGMNRPDADKSAKERNNAFPPNLKRLFRRAQEEADFETNNSQSAPPLPLSPSNTVTVNTSTALHSHQYRLQALAESRAVTSIDTSPHPSATAHNSSSSTENPSTTTMPAAGDNEVVLLSVRRVPAISSASNATASTVAMKSSNNAPQTSLNPAADSMLYLEDEALNPITANSSVTVMGTVQRIEADMLFQPENTLIDSENSTLTPPSSLLQGTPPSPQTQTTKVLSPLVQELSAVSKWMEDSMYMQNSLEDLEDEQAKTMREALLRYASRFGSYDKTVLGLAMSLRAVRLQQLSPLHVSSVSLPALTPTTAAAAGSNGSPSPSRNVLLQRHYYRDTRQRWLSRSFRQQLALETLQLWAPLSFQLQLAAYTPELEWHSYVQLFPTSFTSFVSWYGVFRPLARRVIENFRKDFEECVRDPTFRTLDGAGVDLSESCLRLIIQSRLKTPPSAFKKMIRAAKQKEDLYDLAGIRIIAVLRNANGDRNSNRSGDKSSGNQQVQQYDNGSDQREGNEADPQAKSASEEQHVIDIDSSRSAAPPSAVEAPRNGLEPSIADGMVSSTDIATSVPSESYLLLEEESRILQQIRQVARSLPEWQEDAHRYKDYVSRPKASGYQSLHTALLHPETGLRIELQIRSERMHWEAEYGAASHNNYKALLLPTQAS